MSVELEDAILDATMWLELLADESGVRYQDYEAEKEARALIRTLQDFAKRRLGPRSLEEAQRRFNARLGAEIRALPYGG